MLEDSQFSSPQVRTPLDTMMHLLPDAGQVIGEERLRNWHAMVFFALAFCEPWFSKFERSFSFFLATLHGFVRICFTPKDLFQNVSVTFLLQEMEDGNAIVLQNEIVEADGSTHAIQKSTGNTKFQNRCRPAKARKGSAAYKKFYGAGKKETRHGRFLCIRGRFTRKVIMKPLFPKSNVRGAPGGAESSCEILPHLKKHVNSDKVIACTDAGTGLKKAFSILNVPHATARHNVDEMTPVKSFRLSRMAKGQAKVLFRAAAKSKPAAVLSAGKAVAKVVAGDNAAESEFARSKNQLRRIGKLGRMSPKTSHIDVLAVRRLLERPGLATCVAALARYRKSRAGQLGHAPGDAYDITKDHAWLFD